MRPDIGVDMARQYFGAVDEEMVGARDLAEIDLDVALVRQLVDELLHRLRRYQGVLVALQDQPGRRARREKGEVVLVGRRRDRDERLDFRPPHQELHADPRAKGIAGDPARGGVRVVALQPIECRRRIGELALAAIKAALTAADPAKVEAQGRKTAPHKGLIERVDDLVVHRPAMQRMRVQHHGHRRGAAARMVIARLDAPFRAVDNDVRHGKPDSIPTPQVNYCGPAWLPRYPPPFATYLIAGVGQLYC